MVPALHAALVAGTPLLLALTPASPTRGGVAPEAVPAHLRDLEISRGCAVDHGGWLAAVVHERPHDRA